MGGATNAFSAASVTTVNAGGTLDLGGLGLTQTINTVNLAGGVIQNGTLTSVNGITSTGGTVDGIGGRTGLTVNSGVTTLSTTTGANTYSGATTINGGTLVGGAMNAFSAASPTRSTPAARSTSAASPTQTINVTLGGGVVQNGTLTEPMSLSTRLRIGRRRRTTGRARDAARRHAQHHNRRQHLTGTDVVGIASPRCGGERIQPQQRNGCGRPHRRRFATLDLAASIRPSALASRAAAPICVHKQDERAILTNAGGRHFPRRHPGRRAR